MCGEMPAVKMPSDLPLLEEKCRPPEPTWFDIRDAINEDFRKQQLEEADKPKSN